MRHGRVAAILRNIASPNAAPGPIAAGPGTATPAPGGCRLESVMHVLPWFKIYAAEILSDENFQGWDVTERGSWFTLLCVAWREGSIPADQQSLARLLHIDSSAMRHVWSAIGSRFVEHPDHPGRLTSPRLEMEREAAEVLHKKKSGAGKLGATSRWHNTKKRRGRAMAVPWQKDGRPLANDSDQVRAGEERTAQGREEEASCSEPAPQPPEPAVLTLPCVGTGPKTYPVTEAQVARWQEAHPGLDVTRELGRARVWLEANPTRAKTHRGMPRFLVAWLGRAQDSARGGNGAGPREAPQRVTAAASPASSFAKGGPVAL